MQRTTPHEPAPLLTTKQLMKFYSVSDWTVNRWVQMGCPVEPVRLWGRRFDLAAVRAWHAAGDTPP
ncbi:phage terminase Nu1 subunit (DNA packaging protein) [Streptomyces sp. V2I9]|nr:phage terminase Nu1 subunit (DNA packaging protein) [Streptomyces sp. V2I9]